MSTGTHSPPADRPDGTPGDTDVLVCESCPGRSVFVESDNADGWISTDVTVELDR
mgnify:FL=1|jgi:hypothetical protein